jgi:flagellar protein FlgJ
MQIEALQRHVNAADLAPEQLVANASVSEKDKLAEASRQFEAILLRQVLGDAQKPVFGSTVVKDSAANSIYRDLVTHQLADSVSKSGAFGLAKVLEPQLQHQLAGARPDTQPVATATIGKRSDAALPAKRTAHEPRGTLRTVPHFPGQVPVAPKSEPTPDHAALLMRRLTNLPSHVKSHDRSH